MPELVDIRGVGPVLAKACAENGYVSVEKIAAAMEAVESVLGRRPIVMFDSNSKNPSR